MIRGFDGHHIIQKDTRYLTAVGIRGDHKRSPFFDADGALRVTPMTLNPEELEDVERSKAAWSGGR